MKILYVLSVLSLTGMAALGEDVEIGSRNIEMRPNEKRALTLKPSERNPYAKRSIIKDPNDGENQNAEEIALRKKIRGLSVSGSSRSRNGLRLLLGDILVERGMILPPLIIDQTQFLKVVDVAGDKIVLGWLDVESGELTGKTMQITYDLAPSVQYVLQGQMGTTEKGTKVKRQEMGILKPRRDRR